MSIVRTRIAPSPTGYTHLGLVSRILINYALARKTGGQFIWRNEDTDRERFVADALDYNMKWVREYGLDWDEGPDKGGPYAPYTQSERLELYKEAWEKLINNGYAYRCFCTKERLDELRELQSSTGERTHYDGLCRNLTQEEIDKNLSENKPFTVRIKVPKDRKIEFDDLITHNHIVWDSNEVEDYIIVKSNGIPTYHLAAMYDDVLMKITHIFRGSEWIATTPVHMLIFEGLGIPENERPLIGHFTVILDPSTPGKKFSKRSSSFKVNGPLIKGYLQESVLNYLMLLGWAPKDNRELFTLDEFIEAFDLNGMQKSNPTWDPKKLDWFNGVYLRGLNDNEYADRFLKWINNYLLNASREDQLGNLLGEDVSELEMDHLIEFANNLKLADSLLLENQLKLVKERALNFWQALQQINFFYKSPTNINWEIKQVQNFKEKVNEILEEIYNVIEKLDNDTSKWVQDDWVSEMRKVSDKYNIKGGDSFMALRLAVVGGPFSPPLFEALQILGKEEILKRITAAKR